jgi:hypothetical protein
MDDTKSTNENGAAGENNAGENNGAAGENNGDKEGKAGKDKDKKRRVKEYAMDALFLCAGCAIGACATMSVMIPNGLTGGGITGLSRILQN